MEPVDCRSEVFCQRGGEVLGSVVQGTQIAQADPFDVDHLNPDARHAFNTTLEQVRAGQPSKILLIRGEAGCGKTHLIRSLRAHTHKSGNGVVAYVHMTSEVGDYRQYLLRQVVRSLSDPYLHQPNKPQQGSALDHLSDALIETSGLENKVAEKLREADDDSLARLVADYADELSEVTDADGRLRYADVDLNTLRILLYRQSNRKAIQRRVSSFLNGEPLGEMDWQKLAAIPRDCDRGPMHLLGQLARITMAAWGAPLIICVDQIEASDVSGKSHEPFLNATGTACELIEHVPNLMVLLSCLNSAYDAHAPHLISSYRHRIEMDPNAIRLSAARSAEEVRQIVSRRLKWLYEGVGLQHAPPDSVFPLPETLPDSVGGSYLRDVLQLLYDYWHKCKQAGIVLDWQDGALPHVAQEDERALDCLRLAWNEFRTTGDHTLAEDEAAQMELLAWALAETAGELPEPATIVVEGPRTQDDSIPNLSLTMNRPRTTPLSRLVGLCEKDPRGNGLHNQIVALESLRVKPGQIIVVVRSTRFPRSGKIADHIKMMEKSGDVCLVIGEPCWQTLQAMRSFLTTRAGAFAPEVVKEWRTIDTPLGGLPEITSILHVPPAPVVVGIDAAAGDFG